MKGSRRRNFIHCASAICIIIFLAMTISIADHAAWDCPECERTGNTGNYCGGCGHPSPWSASSVSENSDDTETTVQEENLKPYKTIGNYVTFGTYPQTKEGTDQTPIEWLVLDYDETNNKMLLISRYGLDVQPYNTERGYTTWEECTLRIWLNNTFLNNAFSKAEQSVILLTNIDNSKDQGHNGWNTNGGNDTQDRIFLLSYAEANHYFTVTKDDSSNLTSRVAPSAYAKTQGANERKDLKTVDKDDATWWWLRSPGIHQDNVACVFADGSLNDCSVRFKSVVVRPALWINLESEVFSRLAPSNEDTEREAKLKPYKTMGNYVTFGTYPQTVEGTDQTPIEWLVLDYDEVNNKVLLLSRYGLDVQPYNTQYVGITWEECTLRTWLNNTFLNRAFSKAEQSGILLTDVDNSNSQGYNEWKKYGGNDTQDRIFLLSYAEVNYYFAVTKDNNSNLMSRVASSAYAREKGAYVSRDFKTVDGDAAGGWWLRSPGIHQTTAARIFADGSLYCDSVSNESGVVRPAMWINLKSDVF